MPAAPEILILPDSDAIAHEAAMRVIAMAHRAIETYQTFSLALSGGSTPKKLYSLLASDEFRNQIDWPRVEIYFGDERCVPPDNPESNYLMAEQTLLSKVPISAGNVHRMRGEIDPEEAAKEYGQMLKQKFGDGGLDLILLGLGDDGHAASLFPGTKAVDETHHRVVANYAEHSTTGKSWRITFTAPFINRAANIVFLVSGPAKANALKEVLNGPRDPRRLPAQMIRPASGKVVWLVDVPAAARLG